MYLEMIRDFEFAEPENRSAYEEIESDVLSHLMTLQSREVAHEDIGKPSYSTQWLKVDGKLVGEI
jgi:hypothetical protein